MNNSINAATHIYHHSTNRVTVALLIVLVTGFGLFAESHAKPGAQQTALETQLTTDLAKTVTTEQASNTRSTSDEKTGTSI